MSLPQLCPASDPERLHTLDMIRGFTLCGIPLANMLWFSGFLELSGADRRFMLDGFGDDATLFLIRVFIHAKFYHVFAFLFGLGFALQLQRNSTGPQNLLARRLLLLFLIGAAHSLLWWGDILRYYAVLGVALFGFRHCSNRQLLYWIGAFSILPVLIGHAQVIWRWDPADVSVVAIPARDWLEHVRAAGPWDLFILNLQQVVDHLARSIGNGRIFKILAMFLLGLLVGRLGIFSNPARYAAEIRRLLWPALIIGLAGSLVATSFYYRRWGLAPDTIALLRDWLALVSVPALAMSYVAVLLLISLTSPEQSVLHRTLRLLVAPGRMALTNYLSQTVIALAIFHPALGDQYGRLGILTCGLLVLAILAAQLVLSHAWLARFRFGPMEWLWRSGTYGKWQPLRR